MVEKWKNRSRIHWSSYRHRTELVPNLLHYITVQFVVRQINKKDGYRQLNVRQLGSLRPWEHRGKNVTWIERIINACQTHRSMYNPIQSNFICDTTQVKTGT